MKLFAKFARSTKGTHVYMSEDPEAAISTLYIKREALTKTPPDRIEITVVTAEATQNDDKS